MCWPIHEILQGMQEEETAKCAAAHNAKINLEVEGETMMQEQKVILNCFGTVAGNIWVVGWKDLQGKWNEKDFSTYNEAHKFIEELRRCK